MINRRKALGALTGSVVAAPDIAKAAMNTQAKQAWNTPTITGYPQELNIKGSISNAESMQRQINEYEKIARGEFNEHQLGELRYQYKKLHIRQGNVDCLKSIANTHKAQMQIEVERTHQKEQWIQDALYRLSFLKRGLWP